MSKKKKITMIDNRNAGKWEAVTEAVKELDEVVLAQLGKTREVMADTLFRDAPETVRGTWLEFFKRRVSSISSEVHLRIKNLIEPVTITHHDVRPSTRPYSLGERSKYADAA